MLLCQYRKNPIEEVAAMEMNFNDLEKVTGGVSTSGKDVVCYCKTCGMKLKYIGQIREEGGNTGEYQCENTNYKRPGNRCPEYHVTKTNDEVNFK